MGCCELRRKKKPRPWVFDFSSQDSKEPKRSVLSTFLNIFAVLYFFLFFPVINLLGFDPWWNGLTQNNKILWLFSYWRKKHRNFYSFHTNHERKTEHLTTNKLFLYTRMEKKWLIVAAKRNTTAFWTRVHNDNDDEMIYLWAQTILTLHPSEREKRKSVFAWPSFVVCGPCKHFT